MSKAKTGLGCLLFAGGVVVLVLCATAIWYFGDVHGQQTLHALDESAYDPIAGLEFARGLVGPDAEFVQMGVTDLGPDGLVDLTAPTEPIVSYQWRRGGKLLVVVASSFGFSKVTGGNRPAVNQYGEYYRLNLGYRLTELDMPDLGSIDIMGSKMEVMPTIPEPHCSLAKLRKAASAPVKSRLVYRANYLSGGGAVYEMTTGDGPANSVVARFDSHCKLVGP